MRHRSVNFLFLPVIGVSLAIGVLLGGWVHSPEAARVHSPAAQPAMRPAPAPAAASVSGIRDFADVAEQSMTSIVSVTSRDDRDGDDDEEESPQDLFRFFFGEPEGGPDENPPVPRIGEGTGFVISSDGYILTNYHVVQNADRVKVGFTDGTEESAEVVGTDPSIDLALLKVPVNGLTPLTLGDSDRLRVGQWVIAIGNPLNFEQTVTVGVLSAKNRRVPLPSTDQSGLVTFLQTDAAINFGNSGGPLLDIEGNVVGINTAIARQNLAEGIGFALPINQARRVIQQLRDFGEVKRGFIGISMNTSGIDRDAQDYLGLPDLNGVIVESVTDDSPAERAGLKPFDVIRKVDGETVRDNDDLIARISSYMPGERVDLEVFRKGRMMNLAATLGERPQGGRVLPAVDVPDPEPPQSEGLGIQVQQIDDSVRRRFRLRARASGVFITDVEFDSLAAEKGVPTGRIVTHVNERAIKTVDDWNEAIGRLRSGEPVKLDLVFPGVAGGNQTFFLRAP